MSKIVYRRNSVAHLGHLRDGKLDLEDIAKAIEIAHDFIDHFGRLKDEFDVDTFEILGMRNLSGFFGEVFSASLAKQSNGKFLKNPHQDGYPDLLYMDDEGLKNYQDLKDRLTEKSPFSPFSSGGIEIKATCGSIPDAKTLVKRDKHKLRVGETRIDLLTSLDWKAHHRGTNILIGILWDFIEGLPRIIGVFYSDKLTESDWGKIVQPKEGGGRTTSVSIMSRQGIKKMIENWLLVINDDRYIKFLSKYNFSMGEVYQTNSAVIDKLF